MRTLVLTLTVMLFAVPAMAEVVITVEDLGNGEVAIGYDSTTEGELVRAFALDITAADGNIVGIKDFAVGDDNNGYGIFPGSFADAGVQVDAGTGEVVDWGIAGYTPVAPASHPDALGAIPGDAITIELGSLYDQAAPAKTGTLCVLEVDENVSEICVVGNGIRGNVVMEDTAEMIPTQVCAPVGGEPECFDSGHAKYNEWKAVGEPLSWCYIYQCYGDADGKKNGNILTGFARVKEEDLNILVSGWKVAGYVDEATHPWIAADFDRKLNGNILTGFARVKEEDLNILVANWKDDTLINAGGPICGGDIDLTK